MRYQKSKLMDPSSTDVVPRNDTTWIKTHNNNTPKLYHRLQQHREKIKGYECQDFSRKQKHIPKKIVRNSRTHPRAAALVQSPQDEQEQLRQWTTPNPEAKTEAAPQEDQAPAHTKPGRTFASNKSTSPRRLLGIQELIQEQQHWSSLHKTSKSSYANGQRQTQKQKLKQRPKKTKPLLTQNQGEPLRQTAQAKTYTNPQSTYERRAVQGLLQMPLWVDRNR
ncbi:hypothetical protein Bca4012_072613 [Brassica carinata]